MDFDDEDLEIDSKTPNNNDYNAVVGMQESSMPLARPSTVQRNVIGRQNSGKFYFKNGILDALQFYFCVKIYHFGWNASIIIFIMM